MTTHESGLGSAGAYVTADEVGGFVVFDDDQRAALEAWTGRLILGDEDWPNAGEVGAAAYVDAVIAADPRTGELVPRALAALEARAEQRCAARFAECPPERQDELLRELSEDPASADAFTQVLELTYEAYYRDPGVCEVMKRRTGFDSALPHLGSQMDPFDETLLERVKGLPSHYREVEG